MSPLRALARVNVAAIERNVARLRASCAAAPRCAPSSRPTATATARRPRRAPRWPAAPRGWRWRPPTRRAQLRAAGVDAPLLVLGALSPEELDVALAARADVVAWREEFVAARGRARGGARPRQARHRHGPAGHARPAARRRASPRRPRRRRPSSWSAAMTHFATADERGDDVLRRAARALRRLGAAAARAPPRACRCTRRTRAATLRDAGSHFDLVRPGVAIYGLDPFQEDAAARDLEPALELASPTSPRSSPARRARARATGGASSPQRETVLATVPIGYGDGWRRALTNNADVLVGGRRFPLVGHRVAWTTSTLDLGADGGGVGRGDEVVLIGGGTAPPRRWRGAWGRSTTRSRAG